MTEAKRKRDVALTIMLFALYVACLATFGVGYWLFATPKRRVIMAGIAVAAALVLFAFGCATMSPLPQNTAEMFPQRNQDPTFGFIRFHGGAPTNLYVKDAAGRPVELWGDKGSPYVTFNGQAQTRTVYAHFPVGDYPVDNLPFYYAPFVFNGRQLRELPRQTYSFRVSRSPSDCYDDRTERYYGWCLNVYNGDVPRQPPPGAIGFPKVDISGTGIIGGLIEALRRR